MILVTFFYIYLGWVSLKWPYVNSNAKYIEIREWGDAEKKVYTPKIEYSYVVRGKQYFSKRFSFLLSHSYSKSEVDEIVSIVHSSDAIKIYYMKVFPNISVVEPGMRNGKLAIKLLLISMFFIAVSLYFIEIGALKT